MIIQEITGLTEKLYLMMEIDEFRELLPGIPLSVTERKGHFAEGDAQRDSRLLGNHRITEGQSADGHCFITFESGRLTFYEINASFDYNETNYNLMSGLFNALCTVLTEKYHQGKTISPVLPFGELDPVKLPTDGYPCDRYIIGAMRQWEEAGKNVSLSFALTAPGNFFFQLRAIILG